MIEWNLFGLQILQMTGWYILDSVAIGEKYFEYVENPVQLVLNNLKRQFGNVEFYLTLKQFAADIGRLVSVLLLLLRGVCDMVNQWRCGYGACLL